MSQRKVDTRFSCTFLFAEGVEELTDSNSSPGFVYRNVRNF